MEGLLVSLSRSRVRQLLRAYERLASPPVAPVDALWGVAHRPLGKKSTVATDASGLALFKGQG